MSRKDEDRILHGLHYARESIDEEFPVTGDQILWLAAHSYPDGSNWLQNGVLQGFDSSVIPAELRRKLLLSKFDLPLRYLNYRRLIKYSANGEGRITVAVTFAGADRAMRLHTRLGRLELWYQERKDGFVGILTTIVISFLTALVAVAASQHLHRIYIEPPRVIFQSDPKSAP